MVKLKKSVDKPLVELLKVQNLFFKDLWKDFSNIKDPRHSSYIHYSSDVMLAMSLMKNLCDLRIMQGTLFALYQRSKR